MKPYWYLFTHYVCVICGKTTTYKQRIYDRPRPQDYRERHVEHDVACNRHF